MARVIGCCIMIIDDLFCIICPGNARICCPGFRLGEKACWRLAVDVEV